MASQYSDRAFIPVLWGATRRSFHGLPCDKTLVFRASHPFANLITYSRGDL
jgi:hypothetical protein